jgi:hypothetical protein
MSQIVHILAEELSPEGRIVHTMRCGAQCMCFLDGTTIPSMDYFFEPDGWKSNCEACRAAQTSKDHHIERRIEVR